MAILHAKISDELKQQLQVEAKRQHRPSRAVVEDALRSYLRQESSDLDEYAAAHMAYLDREYPERRQHGAM